MTQGRGGKQGMSPDRSGPVTKPPGQTAARYSQGIWVKKLALPRPRPKAPETLLEVLDRIHEGPSFPALAADWLCRMFRDQKSYSGYKARCEAAWRGELSGSAALGLQAGDGSAGVYPGAQFMHVLRWYNDVVNLATERRS